MARTYNRKKSYLASLLDGLARTVVEGDEAMVRCLSGQPAPGDEKRMRSALAVADMMATVRARDVVKKPAKAEGTV